MQFSQTARRGHQEPAWAQSPRASPRGCARLLWHRSRRGLPPVRTPTARTHARAGRWSWHCRASPRHCLCRHRRAAALPVPAIAQWGEMQAALAQVHQPVPHEAVLHVRAGRRRHTAVVFGPRRRVPIAELVQVDLRRCVQGQGFAGHVVVVAAVDACSRQDAAALRGGGRPLPAAQARAVLPAPRVPGLQAGRGVEDQLAADQSARVVARRVVVEAAQGGGWPGGAGCHRGAG